MATTLERPPASTPEITRFDREEPPRSPPTTPPKKKERLLSLDVFRGATIAGMLLVNNPGTWGAIYPPLEHAEWNGWTPTDLIFPFFVFIVGVTTHLSITSRRERGDTDEMLVKQILRRGAIIFLLGFLMSLFPGYQWGNIEGMQDPDDPRSHCVPLGARADSGSAAANRARLHRCGSPDAENLDQSAGRDPGDTTIWILVHHDAHSGERDVQRHAGTYIGALLLNTPSETVAAHVDRAILGLNHIWSGSVTYDPEGPLSTLPAIGTAMLGIFAGRWIWSVKALDRAHFRPFSRSAASAWLSG
jgi:hypothetical protein